MAGETSELVLSLVYLQQPRQRERRSSTAPASLASLRSHGNSGGGSAVLMTTQQEHLEHPQSLPLGFSSCQAPIFRSFCPLAGDGKALPHGQEFPFQDLKGRFDISRWNIWCIKLP